MEQSQKPYSLVAKILAIIGFSATILVIIWALIMGIKNAPGTFAYLASIVRNIDSYQPEQEADVETTPEEQETPHIPEESVEEVTTVTPEEAPESPTSDNASLPTSTILPQIRDLKVTVHGIGSYRNGLFYYTDDYSDRRTQVIMIDIENIGTVTSDTWSLVTDVEYRNVYTSTPQVPLQPGEHAIFTVGFTTDERNYADISAIVYTSRDTNTYNNNDTYRVTIK